MNPIQKHDATLISIVIPFFNEEAAIQELMIRLMPETNQTNFRFEIVCVNDGSEDATWQRLVAWRRNWDQLRLVDLSRNFGKEAALMAGLETAKGEAVIMMDADLQHPPEMISIFLRRWKEGNRVVYGVRQHRAGEGIIRAFLTEVFYKLFHLLGDSKIEASAGDFRLMDRRVVDTILRMGERSRFMKGIYWWIGFDGFAVAYDAPIRKYGQSSFSLRRLLKLAFDGILSFSTFPLRLGVLVGAATALTAILLGAYFFIKTMIFGVDLPGFASLIVSVLGLGGLILLQLGLIGLYVGRIYEEAKGRPLYIVRSTDEDLRLIDS